MVWTCRLSSLFFLCLSFYVGSWAQNQTFSVGNPLPLGHSHNDYIQERPLWEALENGFTSIEIDIFTAADGSLRVSHIPFALLQKPSLEKLYLAPLQQLIDTQHGHVFPQDTSVTLTLMIDLKGKGSVTYPILKKVLEPYKSYLTIYEKGKLVKKGPLRIMLSGSRPMELLRAETEQWVCIDGSIGADYSGSNIYVGRQSAPFSAYFKKRASGKLTEEETQELKRLVAKTTQNGTEIRFWAAGNKPTRWQALKDAGVTVINADKLKQFKRWVLQENKH